MASAESIEEQAAALLARRDAGAWGEAQQRELDAWLDASTAHRVAWLRLESVWKRADRLADSAVGAVPASAPALPRAPAPSSAPAPVSTTPPATPQPGASRLPGWRLAAAVLLTCAAGLMAATFFRAEPPAAYATAIGESKTVALSEGSRITMNTATRLRTVVDASSRQVWLERGEAYFDVAHDRARPFVIQAGTRRITVLGTRFAVRLDGAGMRVLVEEGRVRVAEGGKEVVLAANAAAELSLGRIVLSKKSAAQVRSQLGWREGRLTFDQMSLGQAAAEFNRYNARKLVIDDPAVAAMGIGGSFAPTNVDGFTRLLEQGFGLRVERSGDQINISR